MGIRVYLALLLLFWSVLAPAETLRVGIKAVPPFAMPDVQDGWTGISVELWQRIAVDLGWQTEWVVMDSSRAPVSDTHRRAQETGRKRVCHHQNEKKKKENKRRVVGRVKWRKETKKAPSRRYTKRKR